MDPAGDPIITFVNASMSQRDQLVLSDVSLQICSGEFVYLIGRVGSGKTTLIKTINAELPLTGGTGMVAGFQLENIRTKQIPFLRRKLGIVFQDFQLLTDRTVHANLEFVLRSTGWNNQKEIDHRIHEVLEMVEMAYKGYKMPIQLSGGEQQRIVIARALLNSPELILADEPTGNLDPETSEGIMKILREISETGRAVVMATHNYGLLKKHPARTLTCEKGRLTENKPSEEIDFESLQ